MLAFLDFEASSLAKDSYPIEVAWVFEDGTSESYLIRPAPEWTDWSEQAEAIHHISRAMLAEAAPHDVVARRMVDALAGHDLLASAPSWDGKWLSVLLRGASLPRRALRLRDSDDVHRAAATTIVAPMVPADQLPRLVDAVLAEAEPRAAGVAPMHRALADAEEERRRWLAVQRIASNWRFATDARAAEPSERSAANGGRL